MVHMTSHIIMKLKKASTHILRALCINICLYEMNMTTYELYSIQREKIEEKKHQ